MYMESILLHMMTNMVITCLNKLCIKSLTNGIIPLIMRLDAEDH